MHRSVGKAKKSWISILTRSHPAESEAEKEKVGGHTVNATPTYMTLLDKKEATIKEMTFSTSWSLPSQQQ